ncbi:hypothetical protein [Methanomassiliicoccus luminyensis]|mgnify:CR=1 FL=1|jgi:hypothetical protein|uniref:hypothetical protein n=1 Tax=Methanomassiliicoccus luminyensis TaxID=1080712 RepID=UPI00036F3EF4|nr:hypothetical protein [Methanomassiliicoccus luminyensis]
MDEESGPGRKVEFETVSSEKITFGKTNFIEVARKRAVSKDGATEFISLSRGYTLRDGSERYKKSLTIPDDQDIKDFIIEQLGKI